MKNRLGIIILVLICLILGIMTIYSKRQASDKQRKDAITIATLSNKWAETSLNWEDQKQLTAELEQDLEKARKQHSEAVGELSNSLTQVSATLEKTTASLKTTETTLASAEAELKKTQARVAELESANDELDKQAAELSLSITNLSVQIAETQRKLATAEGDKALLQTELKRLMSEKADLERQFNDLAVLRAQVVKLKEELNIARRIEWIRKGIFASSDQKGAQRLVQGGIAPAAKAPATNLDLNVEVKADGSVKVVSPATNSPAK